MRITNLREPDSQVYSSNVYLVRGDWNRLEDVNTLIDVGRDPAVVDKIRAISTGVGKTPVEQVIVTHEHFDHVSLLPVIREMFQPIVYAYSSNVGADFLLSDEQLLRCGDRMFQVIYTPGHSNDSICLYCEEEGVLFVGDTPVVIQSDDGTYEAGFVQALERLCRRNTRIIYPGHGNPITNGVRQLLRASLRNVAKASSVADIGQRSLRVAKAEARTW